jgi:hypothetical protein
MQALTCSRMYKTASYALTAIGSGMCCVFLLALSLLNIDSGILMSEHIDSSLKLHVQQSGIYCFSYWLRGIAYLCQQKVL